MSDAEELRRPLVRWKVDLGKVGVRVGTSVAVLVAAGVRVGVGMGGTSSAASTPPCTWKLEPETSCGT